jgi:hypothetical protein
MEQNWIRKNNKSQLIFFLILRSLTIHS